MDTLVREIPCKFTGAVFDQRILRAAGAVFTIFVVGQKMIQALRAEPVIVSSTVIVADNTKRRKDKIFQPL